MEILTSNIMIIVYYYGQSLIHVRHYWLGLPFLGTSMLLWPLWPEIEFDVLVVGVRILGIRYLGFQQRLRPT